jgi:RimJ/RimL family protein N-acetyltransferase
MAQAAATAMSILVSLVTALMVLARLGTRWIAGSSSGRLGLVDAYLETERLTLCRFTPDDADLLIELDSDPAVMRYLTGGEATTAEEVRDRFLPYILSLYQRWDGNFGLFAAHAKDSGDFVGWFHLLPEQELQQKAVELGYRLRQAEWGKGYATEGGRGLVDKGFTDLDVHLVWAATMTANIASQKVMEKIGMTLAEKIPTPPDMQMCEGAERGGLRYQIDRESGARR